MKLIKNILVAVDFRASTDNVVSNALVFAKKFKSKLTLVHVLPQASTNEKVDSLVRKAAEEELTKINERFRQEDIQTGDAMIMFGNYSDRIAFASKKIGANLVIIGAGEKQRKDSVQLGTTAGRVMQKSKVPVFVIKNGQELSQIKNILCPVDFSEESSNALKNAIAIARMFQSKLTVVSVFTEFKQTITRIDPDEVNRQRKKDQELELKRFLEEHNIIDVDYSQEVVGGSPSQEILKAIEAHEIDLLLMGTTGKSGINKIFLGSVAEKVTREVLTSFITSKKEDFLEFELISQDLDEHFAAAEELYKDGFYDLAIDLYQESLELNFTHLPSLRGLAKSYEKLGYKENTKKYQDMVQKVLEQMQNYKIEEEVRRNMS